MLVPDHRRHAISREGKTAVIVSDSQTDKKKGIRDNDDERFWRYEVFMNMQVNIFKVAFVRYICASLRSIPRCDGISNSSIFFIGPI